MRIKKAVWVVDADDMDMIFDWAERDQSECYKLSNLEERKIVKRNQALIDNARSLAKAAPELLRIAAEMHEENMYGEQEGRKGNPEAAMRKHMLEEPCCEYCAIIRAAEGG